MTPMDSDIVIGGNELPGDLVLTGATGFLGSRICAELLNRTRSRILCIVRGRDQAHAQLRLRDALVACGVQPREMGRAIALRGDLRKPLLGLSAAEFEKLADSAAAVYHCGASVNLAARYESLARINVQGTQSVISLAAQGNPKPLYHVSTLGIIAAAQSAGVTSVAEDTPPMASLVPDVGYVRSKLVAEQEVWQAGQQGVPVTVFRPGVILADSRTGSCPAGDLMAKVIGASVALGAAPDTKARLYAGSADGVAQAIVALSLAGKTTGRTYHLIRQDDLRFADVFDHLEDFGYRLERQPLSDWQSALQARRQDPAFAGALAIWEITSHLLASTPPRQLPEIRCEATTEALRDIGFTWPEPDERFFAQTVDALVDSGTPGMTARRADSSVTAGSR